MPPTVRPARRLIEPPWRDALLAAGLFALGALLYSAGLYSLDSTGTRGTPPWRLGLLAVGCAALLLRRRRPVLAVLLVAPVAAVELWAGLSLVMAFVVGDLLYCATRYGSEHASRAMVWLTAATPVVSLAVSLWLLEDWRGAVLRTLQVVALPVISVGWGREVRQHQRVADAERVRSVQLARIAELDRAAAVAEERARMARDLHDVIAGHLSAIAIQSEAVLSVADRDQATVRTVLGSVRENSIAALEEMRAMIDLLRTRGQPADPAAAPPRLGELARLLDSARVGGLRVEPTGAAPSDGLPSVVDLTAYRIVQEALTNAVRHAEGARAWVEVRRDGGTLVVEVTNELPATGTGDRGRAGSGTGLLNMTERAGAVGGTLTAGRHDGTWVVRAELPTRPGGGPGGDDRGGQG